MRTIKFRGKRIDNGQWVYGGIHHVSGDAVTIIEPIDRDEISVAHRLVKASTVGQFTGLFDKNGKEIWEGDIYKTVWDGYIDRMVYDKTYLVLFYFGCFCGGKDLYECAPLGWEQTDSIAGIVECNTEYIEVIGNIHDNPDLLQQ